MKVIKEPVPFEWSIEKECVDDYDVVGCNALLEVDISDIYLSYQQGSYWSCSDQEYCSYTERVYKFKCPCCGKENRIDSDSIPDRAKLILANRDDSKKSLEAYQKKLRRS